ncbi:MAG: redox-sensing transcriptional repressor Rex, partial [Blautia sp.]|nr:redox-sensing transcriptional repressor Rex [Blautia sp.]
SFQLVGIFDANEALKGKTIYDLPVYMMEELPDFLKDHSVEIAILTVPKQHAQMITDVLVENGVKAIWNFAHLDLSAPEDVIVENVHLSESLMTLSYNLSKYREEHTKEPQ